MSDEDPLAYTEGEVIGSRYRIVGQIGHGATSDVYEATDLADQSVVALKIMNSARLRDPVARQRFMREAAVQGMIRHPNVAEVRGNGVTASNEPYLVLELFSGRCLRTVLGEVHQRLDLSLACAYSLQALSGLAACHAAGVRHRDLKPENMMMRPAEGDNEQVVLIDFGFASLEGQERLTSHGYVVGSMSYMAPERLMGDVGDARADVYAMGIVLFELLTGSRPYSGDRAEVAYKHLKAATPSPRQAAPGAEIPVGIDAVVQKALAKDPGDRFQSAEEMAEALARVAVARTTQSYEAATALPEAVLVYCDLDGVEKTCALGTEPIDIGRAPECAIRSDDPLVSRHHARVMPGDDGNYWIEDLGSTNGVYVGVERLTRASLPFDDLVFVGSLVLQLRPSSQDHVVAELRPGIHTRLWTWLRAHRTARAAFEEERDALGHRLAELHDAVERLTSDPDERATAMFADELKLLREDKAGLQAALAEADAERVELTSQLDEARRALSKAIEKRMSESFAANSEKAAMADELVRRERELEDLRGHMRTRQDELRSTRQDLEAMAQEATLSAGEETLALIQAQTGRARLAERVSELEDTIADLRAELAANTEPAPEPRVSPLAEELSAEIAELRQSHTRSAAAAARLRVQLEMAMTELQTRGAERGPDAHADRERLMALEAEVQVLRERNRAAEDELAGAREALIGARAEAEAAWAEVEHLRDETGGN